MYSVRPLPEFTEWLDMLSDSAVRGGWWLRASSGRLLIVLLAGGSKRTQKADIKRARALAARLD